ncbi:hypothetical protein G6F64_014858 [Rhizopus arrhizus]|uniref:Uncharacterized protein n=1 Tax=Rhizopus oryzae TaxID=64495 RepID=A0A9P6WT83_RHIOR|nr:hypothetical protein G6F64_014858 [Rhizopus arrhizus]
MLLQHRAAIIHARALDPRGQGGPARRGEFGLRIEQAEHARVGREAGGDLGEAVGTDALAGGRGLQAGQAAAERRVDGDGRWRRHLRRRCESGRQAERGQNGHGVLRVAVAGPS